MKKAVLISILLLLVGIAQAQVSQTVNVTTAGTLATLASSYLTSVTNLTVTGSIDARDVATMRDAMPVLSVLDLSGASIVAYTGVGTYYTYISTTFFPANELPQYSFYNPNSSAKKTTLTDIILPTTITSIGSYAFNGCNSLTSIAIPTVVTNIGTSAFNGCTSFTSFTITAGISSIGSSAFNNCSSLISFVVDNANLTYASQDGLLFNKAKTTLIQCPATKTDISIPASVTSIGSYAFSGCISLSTITIPSWVTTIGSSAFYGCSSLSTISIPSGVTSIGSSGAFTELCL